jgi:hypothetical protein
MISVPYVFSKHLSSWLMWPLWQFTSVLLNISAYCQNQFPTIVEYSVWNIRILFFMKACDNNSNTFILCIQWFWRIDQSIALLGPLWSGKNELLVALDDFCCIFFLLCICLNRSFRNRKQRNVYYQNQYATNQHSHFSVCELQICF